MPARNNKFLLLLCLLFFVWPCAAQPAENVSHYVDGKQLKLVTVFKKSYRRGQEIKLIWQYGNPTETIIVELIDGQGNNLLLPIDSNKKVMTVCVPTKLKTGKGYTLKLTLAGLTNDSYTSPSFTIHHRIPLLAKALPLAVLGVLLVKGNGNGQVESVLPSPIGPN